MGVDRGLLGLDLGIGWPALIENIANQLAVKDQVYPRLVGQSPHHLPCLLGTVLGITATFLTLDSLFFHAQIGSSDVARDLSDVWFVCEAYLLLLQNQITGQTFNICSGSSIHLLRVIELLGEISGHDPWIEADPAFVRIDEIKDLRGSPRRLFEAVGNIHIISHREILGNIYQSLNYNAAPASSTGT